MDDFDNRTEFDKEVDEVKQTNEQARYVYGLIQELEQLKEKQIADENDDMDPKEKKKRMKYRDSYEKDSDLYKKYDYIEPFTEEDELRMKDIKKELTALNPKFVEVSGNINHIGNNLMMKRLTDILSSN